MEKLNQFDFDKIYKETNDSAIIEVGLGEKPGELIVLSIYTSIGGPATFRSFDFDGETGFLKIGSITKGLPGKILLGNTTNDQAAIELDGEKARMTLGGLDHKFGKINIKSKSGDDTIVMNGRLATITLGGDGQEGEIKMKSKNGKEVINLDGNYANLIMGGEGQDGDIRLKNEEGTEVISLDAQNANITLGGARTNGDIVLKNAADIETIKILGSNGDIEFLHADLAEEFDIRQTGNTILPGTVMVLDEESKLVPSHEPYDAKVVGVISGAGAYKPGIILDRKGGDNRQPIAMIGKVHCLVDAETHPIQVGDMLTTSEKQGHAMKAVQPGKAFGAVIGKALGSLSQGTGLIPVLVNLQ